MKDAKNLIRFRENIRSTGAIVGLDFWGTCSQGQLALGLARKIKAVRGQTVLQA